MLKEIWTRHPFANKNQACNLPDLKKNRLIIYGQLINEFLSFLSE